MKVFYNPAIMQDYRATKLFTVANKDGIIEGYDHHRGALHDRIEKLIHFARLDNVDVEELIKNYLNIQIWSKSSINLAWAILESPQMSSLLVDLNQNWNDFQRSVNKSKSIEPSFDNEGTKTKTLTEEIESDYHDFTLHEFLELLSTVDED